jgi:hypothetical protein
VGRVIKLMAEYGGTVLWGVEATDIGPINPDDLPLTRELKSALHAWSASYDRTLNQEYPPDSGFANSAEEEAFDAEGRRLWMELQAQLGPEYKVVFYSNRESRLLE